MASSISLQAPKRPSTTKSVSTLTRPSLMRTQSNTSKARANSAGAPSPSARTRTPKVVSKKPRREKRSRSARISRWRAWRNASDMDSGPKAYSRRAGCVKHELAVARLGSGVERQGLLGELGRGSREGEEPRGLAQHGGVDEEPPVPALGDDHHPSAALSWAAVRAVDRVRRRDERVGRGEDGELLRRQRAREVG